MMYGARRDPRLSHRSKLSHGAKLSHGRKLDPDRRMGLINGDSFGAATVGERVAQYDAAIRASKMRGDRQGVADLLRQRDVFIERVRAHMQRQGAVVREAVPRVDPAMEMLKRSYKALERFVRGALPQQRMQYLLDENNVPAGLLIGGADPDALFGKIGSRALMIASVNGQRASFSPHGHRELIVTFEPSEDYGATVGPDFMGPLPATPASVLAARAYSDWVSEALPGLGTSMMPGDGVAVVSVLTRSGARRALATRPELGRIAKRHGAVVKVVPLATKLAVVFGDTPGALDAVIRRVG